MPTQLKYKHNFPFALEELRPGESAVERFEELGNNPVFSKYGAGSNTPLLLYVAYMGHGSGLHKAVPDWRERKKVAADLAGIKPGDSRRESVLNLTHEGVLAMRVEWIRQYCPMEFAEYDALMEFYYQTLTDVSKAKTLSEGKDLATEYNSWMTLTSKVPTIRVQLQDLAEQLFIGDEELRQRAIEKSKPKAAANSVEGATLARRNRRE